MADIDKLCIPFLLLIVLFCGAVDAYKSCTDNYSYLSRYTLCEDHQYCCREDGYAACCNYTLTVGAIVGIVIGGMFVIGFIVVCICICAQKSKAKQGHMIHPSNQVHVAYVGISSTQRMPYGGPGQGNMYGTPPGPSNLYDGQQVAPPPYGESQYPPHPAPNGFQQTTK